MNKTILGRHGNERGHWVGDGFPVRSLFSYNALDRHISPFLLLDYAGPHYFAPTTERRGVGQHPHRGFETVTIVYDGEVEHKDSAGNGGVRSEEPTYELQSLMSNSDAVVCLKKKSTTNQTPHE